MEYEWDGGLFESLRSESAVAPSTARDGKFLATEPAGDWGRRITILSIDEGGVRGVITATILRQLEEFLQVLDRDPNVRIVDYFDLIAGTSAGGLITAMLTTPSQKEPTRPMFTAAEIVHFYRINASGIFPPHPFGNILKMRRKYNLKGPEKQVNKYFHKDQQLKHMLTHVIIPSYDAELKKPVLFSSIRAEQDVLENAPLNWVCLATLATRPYFSPVQFKLRDPSNPVRQREFNLIDGVGMNNPTSVAIRHAITEVRRGRMCSDRVNNKLGYGDLLVLSLGTRYQVQSSTSVDKVDLSEIFELGDSSKNYLRITTGVRNPKGSLVSLDDSANLNNLIAEGNKLLKDPVAEIGDLVPASSGKTNHEVLKFSSSSSEPASSGKTNREALKSFAQFLSQEREARLTATKKTPKNQAPTLPPPPAAPAAAKSKSDSKSESSKLSETTTAEPAKVAGPAHNPKPAAVEKMMESQVGVQERAAYVVTFPYHPPQQFFDNPFQTSTLNMGSGSRYPDASFMDPVYTGRSNAPESSESSSGSWRGEQSTTATFSDYPSDKFCESDPGIQDSGYASYDSSAYQMSYPKTQSTTLSSPPDQDSLYQDYFNIFS